MKALKRLKKRLADYRYYRARGYGIRRGYSENHVEIGLA